MTLKMLLPAEHKHGSSIIAVNGKLRVIDHQPCMGYSNGCVCRRCRDRQDRVERKRLLAEQKLTRDGPPQPWDPKPARRAA